MPRLLYLDEDPALYAPNAGGQRDFMDDYTHRYLALAGGWGGGKTWAGARKLIDLHVFNAFDDEGEPTGVSSCAVAQTYQLGETVVMPALREAMNEAGIKFKFAAAQTKYWFELPQLRSDRKPSLIYVRTADGPEKISGFEVGAIWGDEVARWKKNADPLKDPLVQSKGRLRDENARFMQFLMTFTHEGQGTSVYEDFEANPKPGHKLYRAATTSNPKFKQYIGDLEGQLTKELRLQYIEGYAANFKGGLVYDNFEESRNTDKTLKLDPGFPLQIAFDFNNTPGSHAEIGQFFPREQLVTTVDEVFEEKAHARRLAALVVAWIKKNASDGQGKLKFPGKIELFGDASGNNPNEANGAVAWEEVTEIFRVAGVPFTASAIPAANPHVSDRVAAVNCAFCSFDGKVRYKVHPQCKRLVRDFKSLKWDGNKIDKSEREISHASDGDGYRIFQLLPIRRLNVAPQSHYSSVPGILGPGAAPPSSPFAAPRR